MIDETTDQTTGRSGQTEAVNTSRRVLFYVGRRAIYLFATTKDQRILLLPIRLQMIIEKANHCLHRPFSLAVP